MEDQSDIPKKQGQNLETVTISEYQNRFELELNYKNSLHHKKLVIQKNGYIYEAEREEKIVDYKSMSEQGLVKTQMENKQLVIIRQYKFSAFLGIQHIMNQTFLFGCQTAKHICILNRHDIFEMEECFLIPFNDLSENSQATQQIGPHMRNIRELFKEGYYFSYTYDLTLSKIKIAQNEKTQIEFCWNRQMYKQLWESKVSKIWTIPLIQGYIGYFFSFFEGKKLDYFLLARRSSYKAGTRFNARGLDDNGNVANYVELEQIVYYANFCSSFLQIRGSVPLFWQQRGVTTQTKITRSEGLTVPAFLKHMDYLRQQYQHVISVNLMKKRKPDEQIVTYNYEKMLKRQNLNYIKYFYFDLHTKCKGGRYEKINPVIEGLSKHIHNFKFYVEDLRENTVLLTQKGVFRTNCLDCLDRTNVFQTKIALESFDQIMKTFNVDLAKIFDEAPLLHQDNSIQNNNHPFMQNFKSTWADCGDLISKHYTGTGSTHTDLTKKGTRDFFGSIQHGIKSLSRFYIMNFEDNIKQEAIDMVIGEYTVTTNEFEEKLENELDKRKDEFNQQSKISIYVTTWNLNGFECPKQESTEVFNFKENFEKNGNPDIVVIGFQEIDNSYFGGNNVKIISKWSEFIHKALNKFDTYEITKQKDYIGNLTLVYNKQSIGKRITKVNYDSQAVGGMFKLSNYKGSVSIKFDIDNTSFCFTNVHLESNSNSRISNINEIHQQAFQVEGVGKQKDLKIDKYDFKFLFGDFQYDIKLDAKTIETYIASYEQAKRNKNSTKAEDTLKQMTVSDEYNIEKEKSIYLRQYQEPTIHFLPTYKYAQHSGIYDKKSTPSWRDRIFVWPKEGYEIENLYYKRNEIRYSQHRPISSYYVCTINKFDEEKKKQITEEIYHQLNNDMQQIENEMDESEQKLVPIAEDIIMD